MTGHASANEQEHLKRFLRELDAGQLSESELIELALTLTEPFHQEERALEILQNILRHNPEAAMARLWLAYLQAHYLMDPESLESARSHLQLLQNAAPEIRAASFQLLAYVESELGKDNQIDHLKHSIELCPSWVTNHWLLAEALLERGLKSQAKEELLTALDNFTAPQESMTKVEQEFERTFIGRGVVSVERMINTRLAQSESIPTQREHSAAKLPNE